MSNLYLKPEDVKKAKAQLAKCQGLGRPDREKISKILWAGIGLQEELDQILALLDKYNK